MRPLLTLGAALALAAPAGAQTSPALTGTVWTLTGLTDGGRLVAPGPAVTRPTLRLDGRTASGITPCNVYRASYVAREGTLRFGPLATTRRACPDRVDGLEDRFVTLLRGVGRYTLSGGTLTLYAGGNDRLVFTTPAVATPTPEVRVSLDGNWQLTGGTAVTPVPGRAPTLTFAGGRVSGSGGCNRLAGGVQVQGVRLTFGPLAVTRMACEPAVNGQEAAFLAFLGTPLTFRVEGEVLILTDPAGKTLEFRRAGGTGGAGPSGEGMTAQPTPSAQGDTYTLSSVNGRPAPRTSRPVTLTLQGGNVGGSDGCNGFVGAYRLEGGQLILTRPLMSTLMACPEGERVDLYGLLRAQPTLAVTPTGLTLAANGTTLEFTRRP